MPPLERSRELLIWVALPLLLNALLYLAYRDWSLWCFRWVEWTGGEAIIGSLRQSARALPQPPDWVRFSLASGLWIFGVGNFLAMAWRRVGAAARGNLQLWTAGVLALCVGSEVLQWLHWIPGTADRNDVLAYMAGAGAAVALRLWRQHQLEPVRSMQPSDRAAHAACLGLVSTALALATGAVYSGAWNEFLDRWS